MKIGDKVILLENVYPNTSIGQTGKIVDIKPGQGAFLDFGGERTLFHRWCRFKAIDSSDLKAFTLPIDSTARKDYPLFRGCLRYFPAALAGIAKTSKLGNDKHNPGEEMHHAREKSTDHGDCIIRHLIDVEDLLAALDRGDTKVTQQEILNEANQMAWRALAFSQIVHERFGAPLAPGATTADHGKGK